MGLLSKAEWLALKQIWPLLEIKWKQLIWSIFLGSLALGASVGLAGVSAWLIARASQMPPVMYLNVAVTSVRALGISKALFRYIERLVSHRIALTGVVNLRTNIYQQISSRRSDIVASMHRGKVMAKATDDVDALGDLVVRSIQPICVTLTVSVVTVFTLSWIHLGAALWIGLCLIISVLSTILLSLRSTVIAQKSQRKYEHKLAELSVDVLENSAELAILGQTSRYQHEITLVEHKLTAARKRAARALAVGMATDTFAFGAALLGATVIGSIAVSNQTLSYVGLAVLVLTPMAAFEGTAMVGQASAQLVRSAAAARSLVSLLAEPADIPSATLGSHSDQLTKLTAEKLSVGWPGQQPVLQGLDLRIKPGDRIAIVGPSGIGKTTLLLTLAGMLKPQAGKALINGIPGWQLPREQAAQEVSLTLEDAHIFATSVYENLRVAKAELTRTEAHELLHQVQMSDWLESSPDGLDTVLASEGRNISGGERRRILVARALASQAKILLLDEPSEHLDVESADKLVADLFELADHNRGIVLVTHYLDSLKWAKTVIMLDHDDNDNVRISYAGTVDGLPNLGITEN